MVLKSNKQIFFFAKFWNWWKYALQWLAVHSLFFNSTLARKCSQVEDHCSGCSYRDSFRNTRTYSSLPEISPGIKGYLQEFIYIFLKIFFSWESSKGFPKNLFRRSCRNFLRNSSWGSFKNFSEILRNILNNFKNISRDFYRISSGDFFKNYLGILSENRTWIFSEISPESSSVFKEFIQKFPFYYIPLEMRHNKASFRYFTKDLFKHFFFKQHINSSINSISILEGIAEGNSWAISWGILERTPGENSENMKHFLK